MLVVDLSASEQAVSVLVEDLSASGKLRRVVHCPRCCLGWALGSDGVDRLADGLAPDLLEGPTRLRRSQGARIGGRRSSQQKNLWTALDLCSAAQVGSTL